MRRIRVSGAAASFSRSVWPARVAPNGRQIENVTTGQADSLISGDEKAAFTANGFRAEALTSLSQGVSGETGDHILNPGMPPYARWNGAPRDAAVLIPVVDRPGEATVLLTVRSDHLPSHAGQVALPGGKIDAGDGSARIAALREAEEEVGLPRANVDTIGELAPYMTGSGYRITPVIGIVRPDFDPQPNPGEVEDIFEVPLGYLMNPSNYLLDSLLWKGNRRYFYTMPYEGRRIWGVTAGIFRSMYDTVFA